MAVGFRDGGCSGDVMVDSAVVVVVVVVILLAVVAVVVTVVKFAVFSQWSSCVE